MERIIANEGKSGYHIVTSQFAHEAELYAASQLKIYLEKASFAVIPYFSDRCEKRTPEIRVGRNVRGNTDRSDGIGDEGFKIYTDGEDKCLQEFHPYIHRTQRRREWHRPESFHKHRPSPQPFHRNQ